MADERRGAPPGHRSGCGGDHARRSGPGPGLARAILADCPPRRAGRRALGPRARGDLTQLLIAAVAGILVPLWLVLLARGLRRDDESPAMAPAGDSAA